MCLKSLLWVLTMCGCGTVCVFLFPPPRRTGFFLFLFLDCCLSADCQAKSNEHRATSYPTRTESQLSQHLYGKKLIEFRLVFVLEHQKNKNKHSSSSCIPNDTKISRPTDDKPHRRAAGSLSVVRFPLLLQNKNLQMRQP